MPPVARQLPARDVLENLPIFRCQDQSLAPETIRASLRLFPRFVPSASSADLQMTPAWFVPLFRACALSRHSLADWLFALPLVALIPCASRSAGLRERGIFLRKMRRLPRGGASGVTFLN